jgi:hypothetical protein
MTVIMEPEARARLDAHLDAVEAALTKTGNTREQRRGVVDDLEAQILDMLAARSASPGVAEVEAVLATLDPPTAYESGTSIVKPPISPFAHVFGPEKPHVARSMMWAFLCVVAGGAVVLLLMWGILLMMHTIRRG